MSSVVVARLSPWTVPLVVAAATVVGTLGAQNVLGAAGRPGDGRPLDVVGVLLLLAGPVALAGRDRFPVLVLVCALTTTATYLVAGYPSGPVFLAGMVALFAAVVRGRRWSALVVVVAGGAAWWVARSVVGTATPPPVVGLVAGGAWVVAVVAVADAVRLRADRDRATRAARDTERRHTAGEERLRLARDLHDTLGHHVSVITVRAGVALHVMDADPGQARHALEAIRTASRDLLAEMRTTLGVLRDEGSPPPHHPVPGLDRLDQLLVEARRAGLVVDLGSDLPATSTAIPAATDQVAYRVVQEALTNTRRHGGGAATTVRLTCSGQFLVVDVSDRGGTAPRAAAPRPAAGGLRGMRERVTAVGGTLEAGAAAGGWRVRARLPLAPGSGTTPDGEDAGVGGSA